MSWDLVRRHSSVDLADKTLTVYTVHIIGQNSLHSLSETSGSCEAVIMHHQIFEGKNKGNTYIFFEKLLARHGQSSITSPWARQLESN